MKQLSKECIEAIITNCNTVTDSKCRDFSKAAMVDALTNPSIYSKAGLISLEDAFWVAEWVEYEGLYNYHPTNAIWYGSNSRHTTAQLFQIYQQQKEK